MRTLSSFFTLSLIFSSQVQCQSIISRLANYFPRFSPLESYSDQPTRLLCNRNQMVGLDSQRPPSTNPLLPICSSSVEEMARGQSQSLVKYQPRVTPIWINQTLFKIGQKFAERNLEIVYFSNFMATMFLASEKDPADLLSLTDSHLLDVGTPRYILTMKLLTILFQNDLSSHVGATVILKIRRTLSNLANRANTKLAKGCSLISNNKFSNTSVDLMLWKSFEADLRASKISKESRKFSDDYLLYHQNSSPINQFLLANIQFLLVGLPFVAPKLQEIMSPTSEDLLGWNHMWAVWGYAIGIKDEFNVALQPSLADVQSYYDRFFKTYTMPNLFHLTKGSKVIMEMLLRASTSLPPNDFLGRELLLIILLEDFLDIECPRTRQLLLESANSVKLRWWRHLKTFLRSFPRTSKPLMTLMNNNYKIKLNRQGRLWFGKQFRSDLQIAYSI